LFKNSSEHHADFDALKNFIKKNRKKNSKNFKMNDCKNLFPAKNQRPPAEVAPQPLPVAILIPPALLVVADYFSHQSEIFIA